MGWAAGYGGSFIAGHPIIGPVFGKIRVYLPTIDFVNDISRTSLSGLFLGSGVLFFWRSDQLPRAAAASVLAPNRYAKYPAKKSNFSKSFEATFSTINEGASNFIPC
jgi:hypothetical protein